MVIFLHTYLTTVTQAGHHSVAWSQILCYLWMPHISIVNLLLHAVIRCGKLVMYTSWRYGKIRTHTRTHTCTCTRTHACTRTRTHTHTSILWYCTGQFCYTTVCIANTVYQIIKKACVCPTHLITDTLLKGPMMWKQVRATPPLNTMFHMKTSFLKILIVWSWK